MKKCRIGVVGIGRGSMLWKYCRDADNAELVAICDKWEEGLARVKKELNTDKVAFETDFDAFLRHDMDTVVLANYATEHAPFAIRAMEAGKNVISEVLPVQTMAQAVALIECIERTGKTYCYAENYCYMAAPHEMRKAYRAGKLGEFEYGEGEYMHNCEPIWTSITYGQRDHWRNRMSAFYYCTHSAGPLLHITGLRPKKVTGFECPFNARMARMGARAGSIAVEMVTLENGAVIKSLHGLGCAKSSIWYSVYGSKGRMESAREDAEMQDICRVYSNLDETEGVSDETVVNEVPLRPMHEKAQAHGHGGSDFYCLYDAINATMGVKDAESVSVYEALDMWMCGFFAYLSVLEGGIPKDIPDLRDPAVRDRYRNDNRCTEPAVAGDQLQPSYSKGDIDVPDAVYDMRRAEWEKSQEPVHEQLIMRWTNDGTPAQPLKLPPNVSFTRYTELPDAMNAWLDIVKDGLSEKRENADYYNWIMCGRKGYRADLCFFLMEGDAPAATVTIIPDDETKEGYVHMVACREEFRGRGYGTLLNHLALYTLKTTGMKTAMLQTDDWRVPAIKSYLRAGFVPDTSTEDYEQRWKKIMEVINGTAAK